MKKLTGTDPIRTVDTAALDRTIGTPGYARLWEMIRERIAARDAAEAEAQPEADAA